MDEKFYPLTISDFTEQFVYDNFGITRSKMLSQPWFSQESVHFSSEQSDLRVIAIKKARESLSSVSWLFIAPLLVGTQFWASMTKVTPIINPMTGNFLCYEILVRPIKNLSALSQYLFNRKLNLKLLPGPIFCGLTKNEMNLSVLEHEVLFMYCHDFGSKEAIEILHQIYDLESKIDVEHILGSLVEIFELHDVSKLKLFARKYNYINQIPTALLNDSFISLSSELGIL
jgi:hypothetical protein